MLQEKLYPGWVQAVSALLIVLPALCVPGAALVQLLVTRRGRRQDRRRGARPKLQDGGPAEGGAC